MQSSVAAGVTEHVPTYCYQCVAGPDLLTVKVVDGVATEVEPNFCAAEVHPGGGKVCVKAYGLVQKTYNPHRVLTPMKRTNPKKGRDQDPGFVPISWDEALDLVAGKLNAVRAAGLTDESGYPRLAVSLGGAGTPQSYMGTFSAFLGAWGPVDMGFGSGQGVKCYHSEHLYGEFWHRAFTVSPDTPLCDYLISCGANVEASGGVVGVWRHANARVRGMKRVQVEPHLSVTGACSAEWVPIRPKTDAAFLYALVHVLLHEIPRARLDVAFLGRHTASPYLVGPGGYYLRDRATRKPLVWDSARGAAVPYDTPDIVEAIEGRFEADAVEIGPDDDVLGDGRLAGETGFGRLVAHMAPYSPEWAEPICDVPAATIRRIANEFVDHAHVGETIEIDGIRMPYRPVAVSLGKTVNNGWGGYECVWARTLLAALVGGLEVPGGTLGTTVRLNRQVPSRVDSVLAGPDGFMEYPLNPTDKAHWSPNPNIRNAYRTMVPLAANGPWSQALGTDPLLVDVPGRDAQGAAARHAAGRVVRLPDQSRDLVLGHGGSRTEDGALSVHGRLRLHARRDQPLRGRAAAGGDRPRKPAADPHRRLEVRRAVLGTAGLRAAPARGRHPRRGARLHRDRHRARAAHGPAREIQRRDQQGRGRRAAQGRALGLRARAGPGARTGGDLGRGLPRRERRALGRQGNPRPRVVERERAGDEALLAGQVVPVPHARREAPALRAAVPGTPAADRRGARSPSARARHELVGQAADRVPGAADMEGLRSAVDRRAGEGRRHGAGLSVLAPHCAQHAVRLGRQCRHAAHQGGRRQRQGPSRRDHQYAARPRARHRRRRPGGDRHAAAPRSRPRRAAAGHPPGHAAAARPVRPLGDPVHEGLRHAQHELADGNVDGPDRRDRIERRRRARQDQCR